MSVDLHESLKSHIATEEAKQMKKVRSKRLQTVQASSHLFPSTHRNMQNFPTIEILGWYLPSTATGSRKTLRLHQEWNAFEYKNTLGVNSKVPSRRVNATASAILKNH